jgi:hypothetical protein
MTTARDGVLWSQRVALRMPRSSLMTAPDAFEARRHIGCPTCQIRTFIHLFLLGQPRRPPSGEGRPRADLRSRPEWIASSPSRRDRRRPSRRSRASDPRGAAQGVTRSTAMFGHVRDTEPAPRVIGSPGRMAHTRGSSPRLPAVGRRLSPRWASGFAARAQAASQRPPAHLDEHKGVARRRVIHPDRRRNGARPRVHALPDTARRLPISPARRRLMLACRKALVRDDVHHSSGVATQPPSPSIQVIRLWSRSLLKPVISRMMLPARGEDPRAETAGSEPSPRVPTGASYWAAAARRRPRPLGDPALAPPASWPTPASRHTRRAATCSRPSGPRASGPSPGPDRTA